MMFSWMLQELRLHKKQCCSLSPSPSQFPLSPPPAFHFPHIPVSYLSLSRFHSLHFAFIFLFFLFVASFVLLSLFFFLNFLLSPLLHLLSLRRLHISLPSFHLSLFWYYFPSSASSFSLPFFFSNIPACIIVGSWCDRAVIYLLCRVSGLFSMRGLWGLL